MTASLIKLKFLFKILAYNKIKQIKKLYVLLFDKLCYLVKSDYLFQYKLFFYRSNTVQIQCYTHIRV